MLASVEKELARIGKWAADPINKQACRHDFNLSALEQSLREDNAIGAVRRLHDLWEWLPTFEGLLQFRQHPLEGWRQMDLVWRVHACFCTVWPKYACLGEQGGWFSDREACTVLCGAFAFRRYRSAWWFFDNYVTTLAPVVFDGACVSPIPPFMFHLAAIGRGVTIHLPYSNKYRLGPYKTILDAWDDPAKLDLAIRQACDLHVRDIRPQNEFKTPYNLFPAEILSIYRMREAIGLDTPIVDHPLLTDNPLARVPEHIEPLECELLDQVMACVRKNIPDYPDVDAYVPPPAEELQARLDALYPPKAPVKVKAVSVPAQKLPKGAPSLESMQKALVVLGVGQSQAKAFDAVDPENPDAPWDQAVFACVYGNSDLAVDTDWKEDAQGMLAAVGQKACEQGLNLQVEDEESPLTIVLPDGRRLAYAKGRCKASVTDVAAALDAVLAPAWRVYRMKGADQDDMCVHMLLPAAKWQELEALLGVKGFQKVFGLRPLRNAFVKHPDKGHSASHAVT